MQILITGGTGFIGTAVSRALLADGHRLHVWSRAPAKTAHKVPRAKVVDALDKVEASSLDAVVNLAGAPIAGARWSDARKRVLRQSRVELTRRLMQWLGSTGHKPEVLVSASAVGYYGDQKDAQVTLTTTPVPDFAHELCRDWEAAARPEDFRGRICILRLGVVLGRGGALAKLLPFYKMGLGGTLGSGAQWVPWIHIDDVVMMIRRALANDSYTGVYNAVSPHPVRQKDFSRALAAALKRPRLGHSPGWVLRTTLGEMAVLLLGGQRIVDGGTPGMEFAFPQLQEALAECLR